MKPDFLAQFRSHDETNFTAKLERDSDTVLLTGRYQGKQVYYYLQIPTHRKQAFKRLLLLGKPFTPAQYGKILACGYGEPSVRLVEQVGS